MRKTYKTACSPREDSDQPVHLSSLISLSCLHEESLGPYLPVQCTAKTLIVVYCYFIILQGIVDKPDPCSNKEFAQTAAFSVFCAILIAMSYHLSRSASDPGILW